MIGDVPLANGTVDAVISNCVISLSADKARVFAEAARVLRPGRRLGVTDVVVDGTDLERQELYDEACIGTALTQAEYERHLSEAGFEGVEIRETHRVHERAGSMIVRANKAAPLSR